MRILLAANASHVPPRGGATRSNLAWLDELAAHGHECRIVGAALAHDDAGRLRQVEGEEIQAESLSAEAAARIQVVRRNQIVVRSTADPALRSQALRDQIAGFRPDWVLASSEDLGQMLLREAHRHAPGRVVYLAHTPQLFPFGPASWNASAEGTELVRKCAGVVAIGSHMAGYIEQHAGCRAEVIHPPIYGGGAFENFACFEDGMVTIINPCGLKGISIFLALAESFPDRAFGALPGWGTTSQDRMALEALPNVRMLANVKHISQVLRKTSVLLMPSLWVEGFGLSAMEALLHGIPVLASDSGGLREAKMGTRFVLPVRLVESYEPVFDEHGLPRAVIPAQDVGPWADALRALLSDPTLYEDESRTSQERALRFVGGIDPGCLEQYLLSLRTASGAPPLRDRDALAGLSADRRALLLRGLRKKGGPV